MKSRVHNLPASILNYREYQGVLSYLSGSRTIGIVSVGDRGQQRGNVFESTLKPVPAHHSLP